MRRLAAADLARLLEFLRASYAALGRAAFRTHILSGLRTLIPCDIVSYNEVDPQANQVSWLTEPADALDFPDSTDTFNRHIPEHPLIGHYARTRDDRVLKMSDFLTRSEFHSLGLYSEFYRRLGVEYQMACVLPAPPPLVIGIALNRRRPDFSERDRCLLQLASPHLVQAFHTARIVADTQEEAALSRWALEQAEHGVVLLTRDGRIQSISHLAERQMAKYFASRTCGATCVPDPLRGWVAREQTLLLSASVPPPRIPLVIEHEGTRLVVRLALGPELLLLLFEEQPKAIPPAALQRVGLTRRETEVLTWLAQGKSNSEIGKIAAMSVRTVEKHLEHIFRKLGVENRTAAGMRALQAAWFGASMPDAEVGEGRHRNAWLPLPLER